MGGKGVSNPGYWWWWQELVLQSLVADCVTLTLKLFLDVSKRSNQIWIWKHSDRAELAPEANYHH